MRYILARYVLFVRLAPAVWRDVHVLKRVKIVLIRVPVVKLAMVKTMVKRFVHS